MNQQFKRAIEGAFELDNLHFLRGDGLPEPRHHRPSSGRVLQPVESDASYFARRAAEERATAEQAGTSVSRSLHLELAERYAGLAAAIREVEERIG
jgi:hypothetical protein